MARKKSAAQLDREIAETVSHNPINERLFIGVMGGGISYADRKREKHGDYMKLATLPFRSLVLEWSGNPMPAAVRTAIEKHARSIQKRRGEQYPVSSSGQTVTLGG